MKKRMGLGVLASTAGMLGMAAAVAAQTPKPPPPRYPAFPSEAPARVEPAVESFDYARRDDMITMRDGAKLHTVVLIPRGTHGVPILLTRRPYTATALTSHASSAHPCPAL